MELWNETRGRESFFDHALLGNQNRAIGCTARKQDHTQQFSSEAKVSGRGTKYASEV